MTKTKYFVIRYGTAETNIRHVADTLNEARVEAERYGMYYPGQRFLIAAEVQSVVVETKAHWTNK